ncbi:MAG: LytTR family DNA-binding domain-containing protein [Gemmatimonadaceae bacterium]
MSVEIETEAVRSHIATILACMPDVFLVAAWAPDQLTATPATLDAAIVEARPGCAIVAARAMHTHVLAIAAASCIAEEAIAAGASAVLELPADSTTLRAILSRLRARSGSNGLGALEANDAHPAASSNGSSDHTGFVDQASVRWLEAFHKLILWHTTNGAVDRRGSLEHLARGLPAEQFLRAHRSAIVNRDFVRFVHDSVDGTLVVVLDDGTRVHASRTYAAAIRREFPD